MYQELKHPDLVNPLGQVAILLIDTVTPEGRTRPSFARGTIFNGGSNEYKICGFTILQATENNEKEWTDFEIETHESDSEHQLLLKLNEILIEKLDTQPFIVSYNGMEFDLPLIDNRLAANWLFGLQGFNRLKRRGQLDLINLAPGVEGDKGKILGNGGTAVKPSLNFLAGTLNIPNDIWVSGASKTVYGSSTYRRSQVEAITTFVLLAMTLSAARYSSETVREAWKGLIAYLRQNEYHPDGRRNAHYGQFIGFVEREYSNS